MNYYELLNVLKNATTQEIKKHYIINMRNNFVPIKGAMKINLNK